MRSLDLTRFVADERRALLLVNDMFFNWQISYLRLLFSLWVFGAKKRLYNAANSYIMLQKCSVHLMQRSMLSQPCFPEVDLV